MVLIIVNAGIDAAMHQAIRLKTTVGNLDLSHVFVLGSFREMKSQQIIESTAVCSGNTLIIFDASVQIIDTGLETMTADRRQNSTRSGRPLGSVGEPRTQPRTGHEALLVRLGIDVPAFTPEADSRRFVAFECQVLKGVAAGLAAALGGRHDEVS